MAILDRFKSVGDTVREKWNETFGEPLPEEGSPEVALERPLEPPIDAPGARALLGVGEDATLFDVREAYRERARATHPEARAAGPDSAAQRRLDRLLDALELLEEELVPVGAPPSPPPSSSAPPKRKRATARHG